MFYESGKALKRRLAYSVAGIILAKKQLYTTIKSCITNVLGYKTKI